MQAGYRWLYWWGINEASVYPPQSTASFSFRADGVSAGVNTAAAVTYFGPWSYASYSYDDITSPRPVPVPAALMLLAPGLIGVASLKRRQKGR